MRNAGPVGDRAFSLLCLDDVPEGIVGNGDFFKALMSSLVVNRHDSSRLYHFSVYLATMIAEMQSEALEVGLQDFQIRTIAQRNLPWLRPSIWFELPCR